GSALMGIGVASGEHRAVEAAKAAVSSPLLEVSIDGARGILFAIMGGPSMTMHEVNEAAQIVTGSADQNAKIIFGTVIDETMKDEVRVTVIATGFDGSYHPQAATASEVFTERQPYRAPKFLGKLPEVVGKTSGERAPTRMSRATQKETSVAPEPAPVAHGSDEIEIPAFIRRKLG
ncbi:cell division protein FtsZ, partial [Candidatus Uhrbacteria bacterium]|nr:cell division protein FtsZ [Candidatus Uhrbacteria bacterium]